MNNLKRLRSYYTQEEHYNSANAWYWMALEIHSTKHAFSFRSIRFRKWVWIQSTWTGLNTLTAAQKLIWTKLKLRTELPCTEKMSMTSTCDMSAPRRLCMPSAFWKLMWEPKLMNAWHMSAVMVKYVLHCCWPQVILNISNNVCGGSRNSRLLAHSLEKMPTDNTSTLICREVQEPDEWDRRTLVNTIIHCLKLGGMWHCTKQNIRVYYCRLTAG